MSRRAPSPEQLAQLADHYRTQPPASAADFKRAARVASTSEATARRAWSRGWPNVPAIEAQLADERAIAATSPEVMRAELVAERALRGAAELHAHVSKLREVAGALVERLVGAAELGDLAQLSPAACLAHLRSITKVERDVGAIIAGAVEVQRLTAGEATSIIAHVASEPDVLDLDAARAEAEATLRAVKRAESKRASGGADDGETVH